MTYANTAFPQQIESNPAILQYVTLPLKGLGVRDLPAVNQDVLDIRKNLATFNAQAVEMSEMLAKGKDVGVEFEPSLASAITNNLDLIKEAAKACYSYQVKGASIDWSDCVSQGKSIASKLTKIDRSRVIIHELSVPANSEVGNSILNNYSSPMKINYALGKRKTWYIDNATEVDVEGLTTQGRGYSATDSVSSSSKRGALLVGQDSSIFTADRSGKFDIDGGEALRFMMNDSVGQYDDNRGTQTIYWRCTNCSETAKEAPTFRLRVKANDENGAIFNSRWDLSGTYRVRAYGSWRSSRSNLATNPGGNSKNCGSRCTVADASFQTLVMKGEYDSVGVTIGSDKTLAIKGRQPIHFMINDQAGGFTDNSGSVEVILQCVANCENLKSHPIILDEEE